MKRFFVIGCALATMVASAAEPAAAKGPEQLTDAQKHERARASFMKRTGGYVMKDREKAGKFGVVLATKAVTSAEIAKTLKEIENFAQINVVSAEAEVACGGEDAVLAKCGVGAALIIVEDPKMPRLLIAPESKWGYLNVASLKDAKTTRPRFLDRVSREIWRGVGMVAGAYCSNTEHCLMAPVFSVEDLDRIDGVMFSPPTLTSIWPCLDKMGVKRIRRAIYRTACREGWAPPPTNEYQKAIWDQVHELPKTPLKIEFDPKKGE